MLRSRLGTGGSSYCKLTTFCAVGYQEGVEGFLNAKSPGLVDCIAPLKASVQVTEAFHADMTSPVSLNTLVLSITRPRVLCYFLLVSFDLFSKFCQHLLQILFSQNSLPPQFEFALCVFSGPWFISRDIQ